MRLTLGNYGRTRTGDFLFLADTGAWYTTITPKIAKELGITPLTRTRVMMADKREVLVDLSAAYVKALDREAIVFVAIMEVPESIIGVEALEALGLAVDPSTGELKTSRPYGLLL